MLAQMGYIIACVDNRGTGSRGSEFKKMTYLNLGKYETIDQINAAKYLGSLGYVDKSRIGIFGWSYGAYMSSLCLMTGADVFKMAIAVAPVTHWKFYDTIYTERFMRTPAENPSGYEGWAPMNAAQGLKGKYLLVHGSADDNVHVQNTMEMVKALIAQGKDFDYFIYPDKNHGIGGRATRLHLYKMMTDFVRENL
jgi:dipeptidyl-peptidase-4